MCENTALHERFNKKTRDGLIPVSCLLRDFRPGYLIISFWIVDPDVDSILMK